MIENKKGIEFSFGWIFAIIVGAAIISLSIYGATSLIRENRNTEDTFAGKELGIILSPVETSLESGRTSLISFPVETRVYNNCKTFGNFGSQGISIATKSGVGDLWQKSGVESTFYNKYIFSSNTIEDKNAVVFVKPLEMPYKVADLIFLWGANDKYCFVNSPQDIQKEISDLEIKGINFTDSAQKCEKNSQKVCFCNNCGCVIEVNINAESVKRIGQPTVYYADDRQNVLLYGAIFADPGIFECQVKRLMKRTSELALLYNSKSSSLSPKGCNSNLESELIRYANQTAALSSSLNLTDVESSSRELEDRNKLLLCKL